MVTVWFLNKIKDWDIPRQTLKEMNKSFIDDVRANIDEVKRYIDRD